MANLIVTFTDLVPAPLNGYLVKYRVRGTTDAFTQLTPNPTSSPATIPNLMSSTEYEGDITAQCESANGVIATFITCTCPTGYVPTLNANHCEQVNSIPATVTANNFCLAPSTENAYAAYRTRIYNQGFSSAVISQTASQISAANATHVFNELSTLVLWTRSSPSDGPMNRASVWISPNCDGQRGALTITSGALVVGNAYRILNYIAGDDFTNVGAATNSNISFVATGTTPAIWTNGSSLAGAQTTISYVFKNTGVTRTIHIGIAGDNQFRLTVGNTLVADTTTTGQGNAVAHFNIWHIFPVVVVNGDNIINAIAVGDGSVNDAIAMTVYDMTASQLENASSLAEITPGPPGTPNPNVPFSTEELLITETPINGTCRFGHTLGTAGVFPVCRRNIDIASCPPGYGMDQSGGVGSYICTNTLIAGCEGIPENITVINAASGLVISAVQFGTNPTFFTGVQLPIPYNVTVADIHGAYTGVINVTITSGGADTATIRVNGIQQELVGPVLGSFLFASATYLATDIILITFTLS